MIEEARAAAKWWADQLRGPLAQRPGEKLEGVSQQFYTTLVGLVTPPTEERIQRFEEVLYQKIEAFLNDEEMSSWRAAIKKGKPHWGSIHRTIDMGYNPDRILAEAAYVAGINEILLPMQSTMWIDPGRVMVRGGYKAEHALIYPPPPTPANEVAD